MSQSPESNRVSRRDFMTVAGSELAVAALLVGCVGSRKLAKDIVQAKRRAIGRTDTKNMFVDGLDTWHKLTIFPGLLQVDPNVKFAKDIFAEPKRPVEPPEGSFLLVSNPVAIHRTLLRNVADYDRHKQDYVDRVLPEIPPQLFAFWEPGHGKLMYMDVAKNRGKILPVSSELGLPPDDLPVSDITIDGREARGQDMYPYTKYTYVDWSYDKDLTVDTSSITATDRYQFIGQSLFVDSVAALKQAATNATYGIDPIAFPAP